MNKNPRNYGFTLVEVLIALALVSLIGSGLFSVYWLGNKSYNQDSTDSDLQYMARNAMQRISSDIVQADTKQEDAIKKNLDGSLTIKKESGPVTYNQSSSNNWLYRSESGSTQAVAEMITNFEPIALGSNLWEITITAAQGSASYTLTSRISPRVALLEAGDDPDDPGNPDDPEDPDDPDDQQIGSKDYDDGYSGDDAIAENRFVLTSTAGGDLYITNDGGVTWQILDPPLALETVLGIHLFDVDISDIVSNGEKLVAVGEGLLAGRIATSDNGSNWEDTDIVLSSGGLNAVTWGQITANSGLFVAVGKNLLINNGNGGRIYTSADGENWTARTSLFNPLNHELNDVFWGDHKFVTVGNAGDIYSSGDGITWTKENSGTSNNLNGVVYNNTIGKYVAVGNNGTIITSSTGTGGSWTVQTSTTHSTLNSVTWGNDKYFAAGDNATLIYSTDGVTWQQINLSDQIKLKIGDASIEKISCANGIFIATVDPDVKSNGKSMLLQSNDNGVTWELKYVNK